MALAVILLLVTLVASYRRTCYAYPTGGGAYVVSRENLGESASLAAAAALLVDCVMTVAVSVTSGVVAVTSAIPALSPHAVIIAVGLILVLTVANLRGTRESERVFAVPTYAFVGLTLLMFLWAGVEVLTGGLPEASTASNPLPDVGGLTSLALLLLVVRAFASGCTALTEVEAISNGVPSFERPKARNAATTLAMMGLIAVVLFGGITALAVALHAQALPDGNPSVISQVAAAVFGGSSVVFYLFHSGPLPAAARCRAQRAQRGLDGGDGCGGHPARRAPVSGVRWVGDPAGCSAAPRRARGGGLGPGSRGPVQQARGRGRLRGPGGSAGREPRRSG